ncbi:MAG: hypothetical protein R3293_20865 [Candidatus Promineifilaceae bacterium]|nr:hypothetical protein [Candidatus Promineifilaceae bacterium]
MKKSRAGAGMTIITVTMTITITITIVDATSMKIIITTERLIIMIAAIIVEGMHVSAIVAWAMSISQFMLVLASSV